MRIRIAERGDLVDTIERRSQKISREDLLESNRFLFDLLRYL